MSLSTGSGAAWPAEAPFSAVHAHWLAHAQAHTCAGTHMRTVLRTQVGSQSAAMRPLNKQEQLDCVVIAGSIFHTSSHLATRRPFREEVLVKNTWKMFNLKIQQDGTFTRELLTEQV